MTWQEIYSVSSKRRVKIVWKLQLTTALMLKDIAQLAVFVRGVNENSELVELLELVPMKGRTGADEFFSLFVTL
jgi:hypothetical protein